MAELICPHCGHEARRLIGAERKCGTCRSRASRRAAGILPRTALTPEQRRAANTAWAREKHRERRLLVIAAYGGRCACCGESQIAFLTIDHIGGGGNAHRRSLMKSGAMAGSSTFYAWLVRQGFPAGFQVMCHNCNFAKSHGGCPHATAIAA